MKTLESLLEKYVIILRSKQDLISLFEKVNQEPPEVKTNFPCLCLNDRHYLSFWPIDEENIPNLKKEKLKTVSVVEIQFILSL
jgi:hypothetical protein